MAAVLLHLPILRVVSEKSLSQCAYPYQAVLSAYYFGYCGTDGHTILRFAFETAESVGETMIHIESESPAEPYVIVHFEKCSDGVILIGSSPFHHVSVYCVAAAVETIQSIICAQPCKPITIPERTKNGIIAKSVGHHKFPKSRSSISGFRIDGLQTHAYKY